MDAFLVPFIADNTFSIMLVLGILKIVAKATPWASDDEILELLTGYFSREQKKGE